MTGRAVKSVDALDVVRGLVPRVTWTLEDTVVEQAEAKGVSKLAARAAIVELVCGEFEAERKGGHLWIRWRHEP